MTKTKTAKLLTFLSDGENKTVSQIARRTGLENVSSTVSRLNRQFRRAGYPIYTNAVRGQTAYRWDV